MTRDEARGSTEAELSTDIANRILDRINADPDDDIAILARELLRSREALATAQAEALQMAADRLKRMRMERGPSGIGETFNELMESLEKEILAAVPASSQRAMELRVAEARLEEAKWWNEQQHRHTPVINNGYCIECRRLANNLDAVDKLRGDSK